MIACGDRTELTLKEFELLTYLMEHINRVVTRDELLDHIWGYDYDDETVRYSGAFGARQKPFKAGGTCKRGGFQPDDR